MLSIRSFVRLTPGQLEGMDTVRIYVSNGAPLELYDENSIGFLQKVRAMARFISENSYKGSVFSPDPLAAYRYGDYSDQAWASRSRDATRHG